MTKNATFDSLVDASGLDVSNNAKVQGTLTVIKDATFDIWWMLVDWMFLIMQKFKEH